MSDETGGTYSVALGESHLEELMLGHAPPPASSAVNSGAELVSQGVGARVWERSSWNIVLEH